MGSRRFERITEVEEGDTVDVAPEILSPKELEIKINGKCVKIVSIKKVAEYARGNVLFGYDVQVIKPNKGIQESMKDSEKVPGFDKISIILNSIETKEMGKGEAFFKRTE